MNTISVALCTYNSKNYISEQLDSILNQTKAVNEIIICDDGSTDGTFKILSKYQELNSAIRLFKNETQIGVVKNFEKAISLCSGDLIFLSDQDDIWHPNKVETMLNWSIINPNMKIFAADLNLIDSDGLDMNESFWSYIGFDIKDNENLKDWIIHNDNFAPGASIAFVKDFRKKVPFPLTNYFIHDGLLILKGIFDNNLFLSSEKLTSYRIHEGQTIGIRKKELVKLYFRNNVVLDELNKVYYKYLRLLEIQRLGYFMAVEYKYSLINEFYVARSKYLKSVFYPVRIVIKLKWLIRNPFPL